MPQLAIVIAVVDPFVLQYVVSEALTNSLIHVH